MKKIQRSFKKNYSLAFESVPNLESDVKCDAMDFPWNGNDC